MIFGLGLETEYNLSNGLTREIMSTYNPEQGHEFNFEKHTVDADTQGQPYDLLSLMHYDAYNFQRDRSKPTLVAKQRGVIMGQRRGLSIGNVREIQLKYDCPIDTSHARSPALPRAGSIFDCNFENNTCGITNEGDFNWERRAGPTATARTGPNADHTSGNGYYFYARASSHIGQTARFFYPNRLDAGRYCMMFQYWIWGARNMQPLKVGGEVNGNRQFLTTVQFSDLNYWQGGRLTLNMPQSWRLFFEVTPSVSRGDIAVDDIEIFSSSCPR